MQVKTRFSPSPTGIFHIGGARTALYSWLFAKRNNGKFLLRIEDTDIERSNTNFVKSIIHGLRWLNLNWDEGPYFQSQRLERYRTVINCMLRKGIAYKCYCSIERLSKLRKIQINQGIKPKYDGKCRNLTNINKTLKNDSYVVRFRNPKSGTVNFFDKIRGKIEFKNIELDDLIIQRSNGMPTYNFSVVVDDSDMHITHVIRGEDHINNTVRQINIFKSLNKKVPTYAHLSMILNCNGKKISKRDNINFYSVLEFKKLGYLSESMLNYLVRLGWSHGNKEIFNIQEMKNLFSLDSITKSPSIFDLKKLSWINHYYINNLSKEHMVVRLKDFLKKNKIHTQDGPDLKCLLELIGPRSDTLMKIKEKSQFFYLKNIIFNEFEIKKELTHESINILQELYKKLNIVKTWNSDKILSVLQKYSVESKIPFYKTATLLRLSITGRKKSPSISKILCLIGRLKSLDRIKSSILVFKKIIKN